MVDSCVSAGWVMSFAVIVGAVRLTGIISLAAEYIAQYGQHQCIVALRNIFMDAPHVACLGQ